jgi:nucleotide-binding universal stress UspA family protein
MTTHGRGMLSRFWLGSIADRLVRQVAAPVLLVRPQAEPVPEADQAPSLKQVLIPLDGSALAEQIIPHAIALGRLSRAEYTLLHVIEPIAEAYGMELSRAGFDEAALARMRVVAQDYLDGVAARFQAEALRVRTAVDSDPAPQAILEYARVHAIDLIALATHGRGGVARLLLGSVADKVARSATIPVLLQRPRDEAPDH